MGVEVIGALDVELGLVVEGDFGVTELLSSLIEDQNLNIMCNVCNKDYFMVVWYHTTLLAASICLIKV